MFTLGFWLPNGQSGRCSLPPHKIWYNRLVSFIVPIPELHGIIHKLCYDDCLPARHEAVQHDELLLGWDPLHGVHRTLLVQCNLVAVTSGTNEVEQHLTVVPEWNGRMKEG